jgi:hypothetical protein
MTTHDFSAEIGELVEWLAAIFHFDLDVLMYTHNVRKHGVGGHVCVNHIDMAQVLHHHPIANGCMAIVHDYHKTRPT